MYLFIVCTCFAITDNWHLNFMIMVNVDQIESSVSRNLKFCKIINKCAVGKLHCSSEHAEIMWVISRYEIL